MWVHRVRLAEEVDLRPVEGACAVSIRNLGTGSLQGVPGCLPLRRAPDNVRRFLKNEKTRTRGCKLTLRQSAWYSAYMDGRPAPSI